MSLEGERVSLEEKVGTEILHFVPLVPRFSQRAFQTCVLYSPRVSDSQEARCLQLAPRDLWEGMFTSLRLPDKIQDAQ